MTYLGCCQYWVKVHKPIILFYNNTLPPTSPSISGIRMFEESRSEKVSSLKKCDAWPASCGILSDEHNNFNKCVRDDIYKLNSYCHNFLPFVLTPFRLRSPQIRRCMSCHDLTFNGVSERLQFLGLCGFIRCDSLKMTQWFTWCKKFVYALAWEVKYRLCPWFIDFKSITWVPFLLLSIFTIFIKHLPLLTSNIGHMSHFFLAKIFKSLPICKVLHSS